MFTNTIINPVTMMIKIFDTTITNYTMNGSFIFYCSTFNTSIEFKSYKDYVKNVYNTLSRQVENDVDEDFDISIDFPFFMTLYAGFLVLPLEHFQVSIGGSFYYTPKADDVMLIFENSLSILF